VESRDDRDLEALLDAAGRAAQPTHPGWETVVARATARPQFPAQSLIVLLVRRYAAAATILLVALGLIVYLLIPSAPPLRDVGPGDGPLFARDKVKVERLEVEATILSGGEPIFGQLYTPHARKPGPDEGEDGLRHQAIKLPGTRPDSRETSPQRPAGLMLVKDHRVIANLEAGENIVRFSDVAATLDPTSVRFVSHTDPRGTRIVEQSFEYDLTTADALLRRYVDRLVTCIDRNGNEIAGTLLAFDAQSVVLKLEKEATPQTLRRGELQAIRLDAIPEGLVVKPTLVWKIQARTAGEHKTTLSYLCADVTWQADYVANLLAGSSGDAVIFDLQGMVTVDNRAGASFPTSGLKLLAGDVNRVKDPWSARPPPKKGHEEEEDLKSDPLTKPTDDPLAERFSRKGMFDYHLYTLQGATSLHDRQVKQLHLLQAYGVKGTRRFVFDPVHDPKRVNVQLLAENKPDNGLGVPLPAGRVTVQQVDSDGDPVFLARDAIHHTPVNETLVVSLGPALDLSVDQRQVGRKNPSPREQELSYEIRLRSTRREAATVRCVQHLMPQGRWEIKQTTHAWRSQDATKYFFDVQVEPGKETMLSYTIHYAF
jgi:hypothetical protein